MKIYDRLKRSFINKDYYISFSKNYIYLINYKNIISFTSNLMKIQFSNFILVINGCDFRITRKTNIEIEISGKLSNMEIQNEI